MQQVLANATKDAIESASYRPIRLGFSPMPSKKMPKWFQISFWTLNQKNVNLAVHRIFEGQHMREARRVHPLSEEELTELEKAIKSHASPRVRIRAVMIRLSNKGHSPPQIAEIVGCSRQTVLHQISRYEQEGIRGLADKPRSGARAKANREYIAQLKKAVASDPRELGYRFSVWSVERLQRHLHQQTEVELAPKYLAELMKKHEIVYRKPKHDLAHKRDRQEVEEKKELLEFLKKTL